MHLFCIRFSYFWFRVTLWLAVGKRENNVALTNSQSYCQPLLFTRRRKYVNTKINQNKWTHSIIQTFKILAFLKHFPKSIFTFFLQNSKSFQVENFSESKLKLFKIEKKNSKFKKFEFFKNIFFLYKFEILKSNFF